jgi:hypothetical protein
MDGVFIAIPDIKLKQRVPFQNTHHGNPFRIPDQRREGGLNATSNRHALHRVAQSPLT